LQKGSTQSGEYPCFRIDSQTPERPRMSDPRALTGF
jgi:hypothetical protein